MTVEAWPKGGEVWLFDAHHRFLLKFSLQFLVDGRMDNWQYLHAQVLSCFIFYNVEKVGFRNQNGDIVDETQPVMAGRYMLTAGVVYKVPGPRGAYIFNETEEVIRRCNQRCRHDTEGSTLSLGSSTTHLTRPDSRASNLESDHDEEELNFEEAIGARDGWCPITSESYRFCQFTRILPLSRPDLYTEVLGEKPSTLTLPSFGLLLRADFRAAFERLEIGFWPDGDNLIVHFFVDHDTGSKGYHGKVIPRKWFRAGDTAVPHRALLKFHYQQCAIVRFRGPSSRFPDAPTGERL